MYQDGRSDRFVPRQEKVRHLFVDLFQNYQKVMDMTADLHDIRDFLSDMRICFIILTGGSLVAIFCYVLITCLRISRARRAESGVLFRSYSGTDKPPLSTTPRKSLVEEGSLGPNDFLMNDIKAADAQLYNKQLQAQQQQQGNLPMTPSALYRPSKTRLADVFFNPEDMRYHRRCSMKPPAGPTFTLGHSPIERGDDSDNEE